MSSLFDDFGFVAVVLQGFGFIAQAVLVAATFFAVLVTPPPARDWGAIVAREGANVNAGEVLAIIV